MQVRLIIAYALTLALLVVAVKVFCYARDHSSTGKVRRDLERRKERALDSSPEESV